MSKTKEQISKPTNKLKQPFMNHVQEQAQVKVQKNTLPLKICTKVLGNFSIFHKYSVNKAKLHVVAFRNLWCFISCCPVYAM